MAVASTIDFAILTIVPETWDAARMLFGSPTRWEFRAGQEWPIWDVATDGGATLSVLIDNAVDRSNMPAQEAAGLVLSTWAPRCLVVADICGGFAGRDGLAVGDLIVASSLAYYALVKETGEGEEIREFSIAQPSRGLRHDLGRLTDRSPDWSSSIPVPRPGIVERTPRLLDGQIIVGERLLANPRSETVADLRQRFPKALGLDMESVGVARAVYAAQQQGIFTQFAVIRGVSDLLDDADLDNQQTRDTVKYYAAATAVTAISILIRFRHGEGGPIPPPESWRPSVIRPSYVKDFIADKTSGFVGREYVFEAIETFVATTESGYLVIEGDPGAGKSAILAEYVRRTGAIAHFNNRGHGIVTANQLYDTIAAQVAARGGRPTPRASSAADAEGARLYDLLADARARISPDEPFVVVIDALDEAQAPSQSDQNLLGLPQSLPPGVHIVGSSRRTPLVLRIDASLVRYDLATVSAATMADVRTYVAREAESGRLRGWLAGRDLASEQFVEILTAKSAGNFMYLRYVLPDIVSNVAASLELADLPVGLENYYESHWRLMDVGSRGATPLKVWVVYVLCELRRPVSADVIAQMLERAPVNASPLMVQTVLDEWGQFLHRDSSTRPARFSVYHTSFEDFLHRKDIVESAGLTLNEINGHIADTLWNHEFR